MDSKNIVGYLDQIDVRPGDEIQVKVTSLNNESYKAQLVELICGDDRKRGTGYQEAAVASDYEGTYPGRSQPLITGSFASLGFLMGAPALGLTCWFYPTTPDREQTLITGPGLCVFIRAGQLFVRFNDTQLNLPIILKKARWHYLTIGAGGEVLQASIVIRGNGAGEPSESNIEAKVVLHQSELAPGQWWLATDGSGEGGQYNGRIEAPLVASTFDASTLEDMDPEHTDDGKLIAAWDFSRNFGSESFSDISGNGYPGQFFQTPTRAVTGHNWDGTVQQWHQDPSQYAAVHFHEDDLTDANWETDFSFKVPNDLPSAVFAVKLSTDSGDEDIMPFFVTPADGQTRNSVALLVSTATYLAYANQRMSIGEGLFGRGPRNAADKFLVDHPEVGNSLYEHHSDGSGVHFSSRLRPVLNLRPRNTPWAFNADTNLTAWLKHLNQPYDIITDERLHLEGATLLSEYRCVITCTHPEYHSTRMLNAIEAWMSRGGRLMYMGGNGFYWRIAYHPENPAIIEVRRAEDGTRAWMSEPGEYYHQFTGEYGGLWRRLGRPPNQLTGVGFSAQGFDGGTYYRLTPASLDPRASFIMAGIMSSELIGDHGTQGGGAAGEEIDRFDLALGSPSHALVIASSENHRPGMLRTKEEFLMTVPDPRDKNCRADMTFFETPSGGAVFSTGSISYAGSLSTDGYNNDIARLTSNVLRRFINPTPFVYPSLEKE